MARTLTVQIVGDASSLEKAFKKSTLSANKFGNDMGKVTRGSVAASGAFKSLGRSVAFASAGFLGGAGLTAGIKSSVSAASDLEEQVGKTNVVFGQSGKEVVAWSKTLANGFGLSQREALTTASSFGALFAPIGLTGKEAAKQSEKLTQLGADLASFYNTDVASALAAIQSGLVGESEPLRQYGVRLSETRVQQEALNETGKKNVKNLTELEKTHARLAIIVKDSALAQGDFSRTSGDLANKIKIAQANTQNLEAALGQTLVPAITDVVSGFNDWISKSKNQKEVLDNVKAALSVAGDVVDKFRAAFEKLNTVTGSTKDSFKVLLGLYLTFKGLKLVSYLSGMAEQMGLFAANSKRAAQAGLPSAAGGGRPKASLTDRLGLVGTALGPAIVLSEQIRKIPYWERAWTAAGGKVFDVLQDDIAAFKSLTGLVDKAAKDVRPPPGVLGPVTAAAARARTAKTATAVAAPAVDPNSPGRRRAREAFRQQVVDQAAFAVEQTALTRGVADDIAANEKLNALLKRRIAGGHDTIDLRRQQLQVQLTLNDLLRQQAETAQASAKAARDARQFRLLGFGPTGEDLIPGVKGLKRQLDAVRGTLEGSFLDTSKTRGLLAHIRQVLSGGLGSVSSEVRSKIAETLADLKRQLNQSSVDVTRFSKAASGQFVLAGAHPQGSGTIHVQNMTINGVHNIKELENELLKRKKQRAHQRRSGR